MNIAISALDTLFFRDGKPFSMGEESWADGVFPPYPSVLYGALRTWYIMNKGPGVNQELIDESSGIILRGIMYQHQGAIYLPLPLDFVESKEKSTEQIEQEKLQKKYSVIKLSRQEKAILSNYPLSTLLMPPAHINEVGSFDSGLMDMDRFKQYLEGTLEKYDNAIKLSDLAPSEPKVGIGRDNYTNASDDGKLYRVGMRRLNDLEILLHFELPQDGLEPTSRFLKLGGEGKVAMFRERGRIRRSDRIDKDTIELKENRFKLYLATPAFFKNGWRPDLEKKFGIKADLIAAAIGKPEHIGGFDMAKRKAKPMLKAVPTGSVFYFESAEPAEKILEKLQGESISDFLSEQGFGIAYVGNY
jgi:CRISPR-associated protein Cmr3